MNRTAKYFSIAVVLSILTFCTYCAFADKTAPALNQTTTGFTVVLPESKIPIKILVTFNQAGTEFKVERCLPNKPCEELELRDQRELYSCVPLDDSEKPDGTVVILKNPITKKDQKYDCQYVTATEPNEPIIFKAGDNTSCPMMINGRYCDPCKGIF
jgi:hypothetical protein